MTDLHAEAIGFEAEMPAGRARMAYWPDEDGGFRWAVESKTKKGWKRFTEHRYWPFTLYALALSKRLAFAGYRTRAEAASGESLSRPTRLLIVGATGGTGRQLVAQALERGYEVTALVRDPAKLRIDHARLKVVRGNVLDRASVGAAMRGQEAVVSALGHRRFFYPTRILSEGTGNLVTSMTKNGARRLVCQTSLGIGDGAFRLGLYFTRFIFPLVLPFYFWDKTRQERIIAASPVDWVIVRPGMVTNGKKRGRHRHGRHIGSFLWTARISRADVASFMLDQLESDACVRTAQGVA